MQGVRNVIRSTEYMGRVSAFEVLNRPLGVFSCFAINSSIWRSYGYVRDVEYLRSMYGDFRRLIAKIPAFCRIVTIYFVCTDIYTSKCKHIDPFFRTEQFVRKIVHD